MLDGPYPPRVIPSNDHPSVQRVSTQWAHQVTSPAASTTGLQPNSSTPCGIPWNRLYSSSATSRQQNNNNVDNNNNFDNLKEAVKQKNGQRSSPPASSAAAATSSLLYRPSSFSPLSTAPPPPTGAMATVNAHNAAAGHQYHADEAVPTSCLAATAEIPTSILPTSSTAAVTNRYEQLAAEHRYGTALQAPPASSSHSLNRKDTSTRVESDTPKELEIQERNRDASQHNSAARPNSARDRRASPFSNRHGKNTDRSHNGVLSMSQSKDSCLSQRGNPVPTTTAGKQEGSVSTTAAATAALDDGKDRHNTDNSNTRHSGRPPSREGRYRLTPAPRSRPSLRTAQWAVKLIDELVAQVALQQASTVAGPITVQAPSSSPSSNNFGRRHRAASTGIVGEAEATGFYRKDAAPSTVADLTTSFLSSRYGSLHWRPVLQEFAVCLHRYRTLSPACAVFREYFIHVDAGTLHDFQLFCRLFAAADILHCSTVEVRRVAFGETDQRHGGTTHTMVLRRYVEVREVVDRLQKMLQHVVLMGTALCVVGSDNVRDASWHNNNSNRRTRLFRQEDVRGCGVAQHGHSRRPPALATTTPRRRQLTADEIRAVKKVVLAWLEDSVEAERDYREALEEENRDEDDASTPERLRHVAFDRAGCVDAYALLQATLEAVKLLCCSSLHRHGTSVDTPDRSEHDAEEYAVGDGTENDFLPEEEGRASAQVERNRRSGQERRHEATHTTSLHLISPQQQQPLCQATAYNPQSPLVRQVLASPPRAYAYPVGEEEGGMARRTPLHKSPNSVLRGRKMPSGERRSPVREIRHSQGQASYVDYYEEDFPQEDIAMKNEVRRNGPSYRQPRAASAATASAIVMHRSPDGRLWSPPRDGVVLTRLEGKNREDEGNRPSRQRSRGTSRSPPRRRRSSAQITGDAFLSPRFSFRERASQRGYDSRERKEQNQERQHQYDDDGCDDHRLPRRASPTSNTSHHVDTDPFYHTYVADLHAQKRWQQMQQQVAAAQRRDACWRRNARVQARQQQQRSSYESRHGGSDFIATLPPSVDTSTIDATIRDIDNELRRRERRNGSPHKNSRETPLSSPSVSLSQRNRQGVAYQRDSHEDAATFARQQVHPVRPPELSQTEIRSMTMMHARDEHSAYPSRIYLKQGDVVATPSRSDRLSRIEQVTFPPATSTAPVIPSLLPSAGLHFTEGVALSKDAVCLTGEERTMLDQLEVALRRLDRQHRRDHAAVGVDGTDK